MNHPTEAVVFAILRDRSRSYSDDILGFAALQVRYRRPRDYAFKLVHKVYLPSQGDPLADMAAILERPCLVIGEGELEAEIDTFEQVEASILGALPMLAAPQDQGYSPLVMAQSEVRLRGLAESYGFGIAEPDASLEEIVGALPERAQLLWTSFAIDWLGRRSLLATSAIEAWRHIEAARRPR